jgi:hypothetical protein
MSLLNRPMIILVLCDCWESYAREGQFMVAPMVPASGRFLAAVGDEGCRAGCGRLHGGTIRARDESMRAETQSLVEEIKQSVRLLRRHL